jgi:predicted dienelactone hydrolase
MFMEMASHGFVVFAMNFHDGSCDYTESSFETIEGRRARKQMWFDTKQEVNSLEYRAAGLKTRVASVRALIDEICDSNFFSNQTLDSEFMSAKIDASKIITSGHSYGGMTAI